MRPGDKNYKRWLASRVKHGGYVGGKEKPEHYIWRSMLIRCRNNYKHYEHVSVCRRWHSYENFLSDMGRRPSPKHTLDRYPDNEGNYKPGNCRWATYKQQIRNRTSTLYYTDGKRVGTLKEWAKWLGISSTVASYWWRLRGTFVEGTVFKQRKNKGPWKTLKFIERKKFRKDSPLYKRGRVIDTNAGWALRLGIHPTLAFERFKRWGTFQKGMTWERIR